MAFMFAFKFHVCYPSSTKKKKKAGLKRIALMKGADFHVHSVAVLAAPDAFTLGEHKLKECFCGGKRAVGD